MKKIYFFFSLTVTLLACNFPNSATEELDSSLNSFDTEIWEQVGVRDIATGDIVGIQPIGKVTLQITGDDLVFGVNGDYCKGKIKDGSISLLNACYAQSPSWVISERAEGTMYIYPRLGAMYYYDLVMKKVQK